jgi:superfamily II DNA or RNA helicase
MTTILCKQGYLIPIINQYKNLIHNIKKELVVEPFSPYNFSFIKKEDKSFVIYKEVSVDDIDLNLDNNLEIKYLLVPKYYGLNKIGPPSINYEYKGDTIDVSFNGLLRDNQKEIINQIIPYITSNDGGVLCLPCAAGKTVLSLYLISYFKVKTLIIVHKTFLLEQWKDRAKEFTNAKIGILQQKKIDIKDKDIVIGMLQSISKNKYDKQIFKEFGMVIFDEAHHAPSQYFSKALPIIACKLTIGLSATPNRTDKLEKILYWYFGDIMYKNNNNNNTNNNNVLVNIINYNITHPKFIELKLYTGDVNRAGTINKITTIGRRNKLIIDKIEELFTNSINRKIIVLSDRIEHLKLLKLRLDVRNIINSSFYIGGMKQELLKESEKANVIFASYSMASEALDIPDLNTLFMVTSRKEVEQSVGRILRKIDINNRPIIYDFIDQLPSFINQSKVRRRYYNKMGFEINIINIEDN